MKEYFKRLNNAGTIVSLVSLIGLLLVQFGLDIDLQWLDVTVKLICSIGVTLGILNNPTSNGLDLPNKGGE